MPVILILSFTSIILLIFAESKQQRNHSPHLFLFAQSPADQMRKQFQLSRRFHT
ncbi:hypothetical protein C9701_002548 [Salmonella enterica subsp. arizonae serovar 40:z4,z24:]|nr:hypothetical protein [Salmonella enterica subsp. arizonae serovar 40:z4,z24:]EDX0814440.1 hypothetical protein [Salmonella enterica subsp. enterica]EDY1905043.1 hypothetical protein [Salmonella enterica subsp. enterica]